MEEDKHPPSIDRSDAEKFDYLRKDLLRRIGHDIRSPAGVAWTALGEIAATLGEGPIDERLVMMLRRSLQRLMLLADRLSMSAELECGSLILTPAPVDWGALITESVDKASQLIARRGIAIDVDPSVGISVNADARWLGPAITELVINAIRHARSRVRVRVSGGDGHAGVVIEDDGPGFKASNVVPRFVRREEGTGLGLSLAMARDVASAHGGRLELRASTLPPGHGGTLGASVSIEI